MNYSKEKIKDKEQFPKIMTKEDTKELISVIDSLNSKLSPEDHIGFNLQFRQVKIPINVLQELKKRKIESMKTMGEEEINKTNVVYDKYKSEDEAIRRVKLIEFENIDKSIKKLNTEETELCRENESKRANISNLKERVSIMRSQLIKREVEYNKKDEELQRVENLSKELDSSRQQKLKLSQEWYKFENYVKKREKINKSEYELKKKLCFLCHEEIKMIFYTACGHLALCKKCYSQTHKYEKKCPICYVKSELVVKILDFKKGY